MEAQKKGKKVAQKQVRTEAQKKGEGGSTKNRMRTEAQKKV